MNINKYALFSLTIILVSLGILGYGAYADSPTFQLNYPVVGSLHDDSSIMLDVTINNENREFIDINFYNVNNKENELCSFNKLVYNTRVKCNWSNLSDGVYLWYVKAKNNSEVWNFTLDTNGPNINFIYPMTKGIFSNNGNLHVNLTSNDQYSEVSFCSIFFGNNSKERMTLKDDESKIFKYSSKKLTQGNNYSYIVSCTDTLNNTEISEKRWIYILEDSPPIIKNLTLNQDTIYTDSNISLGVLYYDSDNSKGKVYFNWYVNGINVFNESFDNVSNNSLVFSEFESMNYNKNDVINCSVYAESGGDKSLEKWSSKKVVKNSVPTLPILITPENNSINKDNSLYFDWNDSFDKDNDSITYFLKINSSLNSTYIQMYRGADSNFSLYSTSNNVKYSWKVIATDNESNITSEEYVFTEVSDKNDFSYSSKRPTSSGGGGVSDQETKSCVKYSNSYLIHKISDNDSQVIVFEDEEFPISTSEFFADGDVENLEITLKLLRCKDEVLESLEDNLSVYKYISIDSSESLRSKVIFRVKKSWLNENNINSSEIYFLRYSDSWEKLSTFEYNETEDFFFYSSEIPGFSYFVIAGYPDLKNDKESKNKVSAEVILKDKKEDYRTGNEITGNVISLEKRIFLDTSFLNYRHLFFVVSILLVFLVLILIRLHKPRKDKEVDGEIKINKEEAKRMAESEILKKDLDIHKVEIKEPYLENWEGEDYWSIQYIVDGEESDEILLSEKGEILRETITKKEAVEIAKKEFERKGIDLVRVELGEEIIKINGREYWEVKYTTSYGYSDKVLISRRNGIISY